MAVRLPLIITQASRRDATATDLTEALVTEAMFTAGIDANLVGSLDSIVPGSTDHLCLQGNTRNLAVAGWMPSSEAESEWQRLGLDGCFIDVSSGEFPVRSVDKTRSIYYFQLNAMTSPKQVLTRCLELAASQQVQLVQLQLGGVPFKPAIANSETVPNPKLPPADNAPVTVSEPIGLDVRAVQPLPAASNMKRSSAPDLSDDDFSGLDQLVADLDAMDL